MKDTQISSNKIIDYSVSFARSYCNDFDVKIRKNKGQFFTPKKVANFMANILELKKDSIRILDPGAGTGILIAAVCDRIMEQKKPPSFISIDAYENDKTLIPSLKNILKLCRKQLSNSGQELSYHIFNSNFILDNDLSKNSSLLDSSNRVRKKYDIIISNPPYYKLKIQSPESELLKDFVSGQPNIYPLFMISALQLLEEGGNFTFIIPRSFCSGLYYKKIRNWFVRNTQINFIHSFESRMKIFEDNITQEIVILYGVKTKKEAKGLIKVSISNDKSFTESYCFFAPSQVIFDSNSNESFIRIPHSENDLKIIQEIDSWENSLNSIGMEISTGKVVDFRAKENLVFSLKEKDSVPLLWMHNLKDGIIEWPSNKYSKPQGILFNQYTKNHLIPVDNYVLLKRFTSKCQKRRLYAIPFFKSNFKKYSLIGLENHLNYVYGVDKPIPIIDIFGLTALFNTSFYDSYYRTISGNTQVNANDLRNIPLPDLKQIRLIGNYVKTKKCQSSKEIDSAISKILNLKELLNILPI